MPTATRVLLINGVNTGISYPIINNDTVDDTTQPQGQISAQQQLNDDSTEKRSIESSTTDDSPSTKRPNSDKNQTDGTPTFFSVAHPRDDSQYLSPRQCK